MHDHAPTGIRGGSNRRLLAISLAITTVVMVVQIVGAALSGSLALLADAAHMFTDAAALVIALIASIVAARPANDRSTFGYQRAEVFGALINAVILIALSVWVAIEGIARLLNPGEAEVAGGLMLVIAVIGLVANAVAMWLLSTAQRRSINVRGAYLEVLGDLIGSVAVIVAAIVIVTTGWTAADAIASLLIAAMIVPRAISLLREVFSVLSESNPRGCTSMTSAITSSRRRESSMRTMCTCGSSRAGRPSSARMSWWMPRRWMTAGPRRSSHDCRAVLPSTSMSSIRRSSSSPRGTSSTTRTREARHLAPRHRMTRR